MSERHDFTQKTLLKTCKERTAQVVNTIADDNRLFQNSKCFKILHAKIISVNSTCTGLLLLYQNMMAERILSLALSMICFYTVIFKEEESIEKRDIKILRA